MNHVEFWSKEVQLAYEGRTGIPHLQSCVAQLIKAVRAEVVPASPPATQTDQQRSGQESAP